MLFFFGKFPYSFACIFHCAMLTSGNIRIVDTLPNPARGTTIQLLLQPVYHKVALRDQCDSLSKRNDAFPVLWVTPHVIIFSKPSAQQPPIADRYKCSASDIKAK